MIDLEFFHRLYLLRDVSDGHKSHCWCVETAPLPLFRTFRIEVVRT